MWQALPDVVYVKTAAADSQPVTYGQYSNLVIYRSVTVVTVRRVYAVPPYRGRI